MSANGIRKTAAQRETLGWETGLCGLGFAVLGLVRGTPWLTGVGIIVAIIGGIMWGAGMARRD